MTERTHYETFIGNMLPPDPEREAVFRKILEEAHAKDPDRVWQVFPEMLQLLRESTQDPRTAVLALTGLMQTMVDFWLGKQADQYSLGALLHTKAFVGLFHSLMDRWGRADLLTTFTMLFHMLSHRRAGQRVYEVSAGLGEKLRYTELRGLMTDDLRLPYENIYIQVPPRAGLKVWNQDTGWHELEGIYITEDSLVSAEGSYKDIGDCRGWRIMLVGKRKPEATLGDDALTHFWIPLNPGQNLDAVLDKLQERMNAESQNGEAERTGFGLMLNEWRPVFAWAMNVVLYVTWTEPGAHVIGNAEARKLWDRAMNKPKGSSARKDLLERFQNVDPQRRILLGKDVRVLRGEHENEDGSPREPNKSGIAGRAMEVRTRVPGHWQRYWHGKKDGSEERTRQWQWKEPFWKGPEDGPINAPRHVVGPSEES